MENMNSNNQTTVSFISINYNSADYTIELIKSIKKYTTITYEIIIIDNDSNKADYNKLKDFTDNQDKITLLRNPLNSGFASANMKAVQSAKGEYFFFINNDTKLLNDTAKILKEFMDTHKKTGLATAKIFDEKQKFHSSYKLFPSLTKELLGNSVDRFFNHFPSNKTELHEATPVSVVSGSCMFFRREVFQEIDGFDTKFFLYCEEEDISKRVWENGNEVYFVPQAHIFHKGGASNDTTKKYELLREYYISYKYLIHKHFKVPKSSLLILLMYFKIIRRSLLKKEYQKLLWDINQKNSLKYIYEQQI